MSSEAPQFRTNLSLAEIENLIRRVVRETIHEEFARVLRRPTSSPAEDWFHEGPDDPAGDLQLLAEASDVSEHYRTNSDEWMDWDTFKAALAAAEAAGELPD